MPRAPLLPPYPDPDADGCLAHHDLPPNVQRVIAAPPGSVLHRRFLRANWFGFDVPGLTFTPGADSNPDTVGPQMMTWFLPKYDRPTQTRACIQYAQNGYWDWLLMYADARSWGVTDDQFVALAKFVMSFGLRVTVSLGSKGINPSNDDASGWPTRALPVLRKLIAAKAIDKAIVGFEFDLWNDPAKVQGIIDLFASVCGPNNIFLYWHGSSNRDSWQVSGSREDWWRQQKNKLRGEMWQADGTQSVALMQAHCYEMLQIFDRIGDTGDGVGPFDKVACELVGIQELYGMSENRADGIGRQLIATPNPGVCVMGTCGGLRDEDGKAI